MPDRNYLRSERRPRCHVCGGEGAFLYSGMRDRLYGAPGEWSIRQCRNPACSLLWLDPMPLEGELWKAYRTYYTHQGQDVPRRSSFMSELVQRSRAGYCASRYGFGKAGVPLGDRLLGALVGAIPPLAETLERGWATLARLPNGRLLEIGCGGGDSLKLLAGWGWRVEGLDPDPGAVECSRGKGFDVRLGNLFEQRYPEGTFDAVISSHVIEHVPDPRALLHECLRVLRPGGRLIFLTPNGQSWLHGRFGNHWRDLDPPRHLHIFNAGSLLGLAQQIGFGDCSVSTSSYGAGGIYQMSRALRDQGGYRRKTRGIAAESASEMVHLYEWLRLMFSPLSGESLKLEASKPL